MTARVKPAPLRATPSVSVVIPCYNYAHFLPAAVRSALDQDDVQVEVIIVDDASPDDSLVVAQSIAARDPRVQVVAHRNNAGHIATYNDGLGRAAGDYVVLLSADDLLAPGSLSRSAALLESDEDLAFVYGYACMFEGDPPTPRTEAKSWSVWSGDEWISRLCSRGNGVIVNPEVVMRREVLERTGGYDSRMPHAADMYLWLQAAVHGKVGRVNGPDQAFYRVHGANMHLTDYAGVLTDIRERAVVFETLFSEDGSTLAQRDELLDVSRRTLALEAVRLACHAHDTNQAAQAPDYADFARSTWAGVTRTLHWAAYRRRDEGRAVAAEAVLGRFEWRVRNSVRWRTWRRTGL